jgi:hypothetical protein
MSTAKKPKQGKNAARPKRASASAALGRTLAQAAWAEADAALAEALAEFDAWRLGEADAAELVGQALRRAGRRRGLALFGRPGEIEPYDAKRHALAKAARRAPARVRLVSAGVARGQDVVVKARATPLKRSSISK